MSIQRFGAALGLALAAAGCDDKPDEEAIHLMEDMAEVFVKHKGDCDELGEALSKFVDDNEERFRKLEEFDKQLTEEDKKQFEARYGDRADQAMQKIVAPDVAVCARNPKVRDALKRIGPR